MSALFPVSLTHLLSEARDRLRTRTRLNQFNRFPEMNLQQGAPESDPRYPLPDGGSFLQRLNTALLRGREYILSQQTGEGWWWEVLDTNTTLTSEFIMLSHFMDRVDDGLNRRLCNYLLEQQQGDGGWSLYPNGPSDLSTAVEAYFALKLSGHSPDAPYMKKAAAFILGKGGILNARVFTKINLALFGQFPWHGVPAMPPQLILLPRGFTFNIYEFSSWSRVVIVPLSIVMHYKPIVTVPQSAWVEELYAEPVGQRDYRMRVQGNRLGVEALFIHLDHTMKILGRLATRPFLKTALKKAERWVLSHQDHAGDWGGILPAMINSLMALRCLGYDNSHPVIEKGWQALLRFQEDRGDIVHQQSCISPVWDTAWYMTALAKAGLPASHAAMHAGCRWLMEKQIRRPGDWRFKNPRAEPGGWAFEFDNDFYPDVDDSIAVLTAIALTDLPEKDRQYEVFSRGFRWVLSMQNADGGWAAFDKENNRKILNEIPFADLKSLLDPSTADITGRMLEFLGGMGYDKNSRIVRKAIRFLKQTQHPAGSWWGRWGVNYIYGTWCALVGLRAVGEDMEQEYIQKAVRWLKSVQNPDGGWGETCNSYEDESLMGQGKSTPSQTAWAVLGLMAAGEVRSFSIRRGIEFLLKQQTRDGSWLETEYTGTGFPKHFYLGYRGYKNFFSMLALAQFKNLVR